MKDDDPHTSDVLQVYWDLRRQRSLRKARDRVAAQALLNAILGWSARNKRRFGQNAGSWVNGMEFAVWDRCPSLHALARKAGGWWIWNDGVVFVSAAAWGRLRTAQAIHEAAAQAAQRARKTFERLAGRDEHTTRARNQRYYQNFVPNVTKRHAKALEEARKERLAHFGIAEDAT